MRRSRPAGPRLELDDLPRDVRAVLDEAIEGAAITVSRAGEPIGSLEFQSAVREGMVLDAPTEPAETPHVQEGVTVVATAMKLSDTVRRRLSDEFGDQYIVVDLTEAPTTTDVVLSSAVSPQLIGLLRHQFPHARVVITEIEDEELGVHYPGPVSRLLDAGASAYLPPRAVTELAAGVQAYLTRSEAPALESGTRERTGLPSPRRLDE